MEMLISGSRVVIPDSKPLIAPWTERLRYGIPKNGYHGGLTPQEMVVSFVVLESRDEYPYGWREAPIDSPTWWEEPMRESTATVRVTLIPKQPPPGMLFGTDDELFDALIVPVDGPPTIQEPDWIKSFISSPLFIAQRRSSGRAVPSDEVFASFLATLDSRGGKMTSVALARAMNFPLLRFRGMLIVAQRVLNLDGIAVLHRDEASDSVELNRELARQQFGLD